MIRYFVVFYNAQQGGVYINGNASVTTEGEFFNQQELRESIAEHLNNPVDPESVIVMGWQELTRDDFDDFNRRD